MARKTMWAVAGALLAFAPYAVAQQVNVRYGVDYTNAAGDDEDTSRFYASEVISSGDVQIDYRGDAPVVRLSIGTQNTSGGQILANGIQEDDTIDVTFTLANATFAENVRAGNMDPDIENVDTSCSLRVADTIDGARGDNSVTFRIEAADADCVCASACNMRARLHFSLPRLQGLNGGAVAVSITTDSPGGSGWPNLAGDPNDDDRPFAVWESRSCEGMGNATSKCTHLDDGVLQFRSAQGMDGNGNAKRTGDATRSGEGIVKFRPGLTFSATSGGTTNINLEAERRTFVVVPRYADQARLGSVTVGVTNAGNCDGTDPAPMTCDLQANGRPFSIGRGGEGRGDLEVNVTGDFRRGDIVYLDLDGNRLPGTGESLSLVDGSMQGAFSLLNVAGDATAGQTTAMEMQREEGVATRELLYQPNRNDPLRPGGYRSSFAVDFSGSAAGKSARPASTVANTHTTSYTVVESSRDAYAIPPGTTGDVGNVRIKCEVATSCTVYLECDHADGRSWFEQVAAPIPGRSTLVLTSEGMRDALGMDDGDWTRGRMSCSVHSTREISLQVLTRSDSGVLVNNTYVDD